MGSLQHLGRETQRLRRVFVPVEGEVQVVPLPLQPHHRALVLYGL